MTSYMVCMYIFELSSDKDTLLGDSRISWAMIKMVISYCAQNTRCQIIEFHEKLIKYL